MYVPKYSQHVRLMSKIIFAIFAKLNIRYHTCHFTLKPLKGERCIDIITEHSSLRLDSRMFQSTAGHFRFMSIHVMHVTLSRSKITISRFKYKINLSYVITRYIKTTN